jgi:hypothetical protein
MNSTKAPARRAASARSSKSGAALEQDPRASPDPPATLLRWRRAAKTRVSPIAKAGAQTVPISGDAFGDQLTVGFRKAVEAAIQEAFKAGLAVPGRENGRPVERRPDGKIVEIEDPANWSPDNWKARFLRQARNSGLVLAYRRTQRCGKIHVGRTRRP